MPPGYPQYSQTVFHAPAEVDAGSLFEVFGRTGHLGNIKPGKDDLGEHLIIEYEVVGILVEVDAFQHFSTEGAVSGMVFRQFIVDQ